MPTAALVISLLAWTKHKGYNCYPGSGAASVDPDDTPVPDKTVDECGQVCANTSSCNAFTVDEDQLPSGPCWLRKWISLDDCDTNSGYDTYDGGPPKPPPPPPPPPVPPGPTPSSWFPPPYSKPWPPPDGALCGESYHPEDADLSGLTKYTDGDAWIRAVEQDDRCDHQDALSQFGIGCEVQGSSGMKVLQMAPAVYTLSQQVWLPPMTVLQGHAVPNVPGSPRTRPELREQTILMPGGWDCNPTQTATAWARAGYKCNRKGFLMSSYTVVRNLVAQGKTEDGEGLGMGLSGGGFIELPGCAASYSSREGCGGPDERSDDFDLPSDSFWTGPDGGTAVHNVLVENLRLNDLRADEGSNVVFWSAMTMDDSAHTNVTVRKVVSMKTHVDGINVHGAVVNWAGSDIHIENTGDDVYAVWGAGADGHTSGMASGQCPPMTNAPATEVSFERLFARQKSGGGYGTCMSLFGTGRVSVDQMVCCEEHSGGAQGILNIEKDFCALYPAGQANITFGHASWFRGTRDLCDDGGEGQFYDDYGLHSTCQGDRGICGAGTCGWYARE